MVICPLPFSLYLDAHLRSAFPGVAEVELAQRVVSTLRKNFHPYGGFLEGRCVGRGINVASGEQIHMRSEWEIDLLCLDAIRHQDLRLQGSITAHQTNPLS